MPKLKYQDFYEDDEVRYNYRSKKERKQLKLQKLNRKNQKENGKFNGNRE